MGYWKNQVLGLEPVSVLVLKCIPYPYLTDRVGYEYKKTGSRFFFSGPVPSLGFLCTFSHVSVTQNERQFTENTLKWV